MMHELVKRAREELRLSQLTLAHLAEVPRSQVQVLEKGGNVTLETLEKILAALGLSLAIVSPDDIATMREALKTLDGVLARLAPQVTASPPFDPRRLLAMTRELQEIVRAAKEAAAAAPPAAGNDRADTRLDAEDAQPSRPKRRARRQP